jgi:hypothetical protein
MKKIKPAGYWTYERCKEEALKYTRRAHLQQANSSAYGAIKRNGWLDELTTHMKPARKKKWSYDECKEKSQKYTSLMKFRENEKSIYSAILSNGWRELLSHMEYIYRENGYWTYERCKEEALKYTTRKDFIENSKGAYGVIMKNKWSKELTSHLESPQREWGFFTYENCKELALKYKTRTDMDKVEGLAYRTILKNKWLELFSHMKYKTSAVNRYIYAFEFSDNNVYVGLTFDLNKRRHAHLTQSDSAVYRYIQKNKNYTFKVITNNPVDFKKAGAIEEETINNYKNKGWNILNKARAGGLGGSKKYWTYNKCKKRALEFTSMSDFYKNNTQSLRTIMKRNGWWEELTKHFIMDMPIKKPNGYWHIKENCKKEADKYTRKVEFERGNASAYNAACGNKWIDEFFPKNKININKFW